MRLDSSPVCLATAFVAMASLAGCMTPEAPAPPAPPEVVVQTPVQRDVTLFHDFTGNTQAVESVEIRARVQGFLESFEFTPSTFVKKGDLLFVIEREPYIAAKDQAEAEVKASAAFVRRTESDLDRLEQAVKTNAVSQQEVTRATAERDQARAGQLAAKAGLEKATINLDYTRINSPINGVISRQLVDPGNLVGSNEPTLLAQVFNINPIHVYFEINEQLIATILDVMAGMEGRQKRRPDDRTTVSISISRLSTKTQTRRARFAKVSPHKTKTTTTTTIIRSYYRFWRHPDNLVQRCIETNKRKRRRKTTKTKKRKSRSVSPFYFRADKQPARHYWIESVVMTPLPLWM